MNFSGKFGSASTIWYPASGLRVYNFGGLDYVGDFGYYWSASPYSINVCALCFNGNGDVGPSGGIYRAFGQAVRCIRE